MTPFRSRPALAALAALALVLGCGDKPTEPTTAAQSLESLDNRQLLLAILTKLDALEKRAETESRLIYARIDSLSMRFISGPMAAQPFKPTAAVEATLCVEAGGSVVGELKGEATLKGRGLGSVGLHAAGNGAWAGAYAEAGTITGTITDGHFKTKLEVCGKLAGESELAPSVRALLNSAVTAGWSITENLAGLFNNLGVNAARLDNGTSALRGFSSGDLPFGTGAVARLLDAIPLPGDMRSLLSNPAQIFQRTGQAIQFGIDRMCNSPNWPALLASKITEACTLRDQMPSGQQILQLFQGLGGGFQDALNTVQGHVQGLCNTINGLGPVTFSIPAKTVDFPFGIGEVQTFPGFSKQVIPDLNVC